MDNEKRDIRIRGNVEVVSEDGYTLRTEELVWRNEAREIVTDRPVWISSKTFRLSGKGLRVKVDEQKFWLQGKVKANLMPVALKD